MQSKCLGPYSSSSSSSSSSLLLLLLLLLLAASPTCLFLGKSEDGSTIYVETCTKVGQWPWHHLVCSLEGCAFFHFLCKYCLLPRVRRIIFHCSWLWSSRGITIWFMPGKLQDFKLYAEIPLCLETGYVHKGCSVWLKYHPKSVTNFPRYQNFISHCFQLHVQVLLHATGMTLLLYGTCPFSWLPNQ